MIVKAATADIKTQSMFRVGAAKPLLMLPRPESGLRVNNVLLISHAPKNQRRPDITGSAITEATPPHN